MTHPQIVSAGLFERDGRVLAAHRSRPPLAGQWLLPLTIVAPAETAEDAVRRHAREQFGVEVSKESFADTVYIEDPVDKQQYVANIFRAELGGERLRFRADGDYDDARWLQAADLEQLWMPPTLRASAVRLLSEPPEPPDMNWTDERAVAAVTAAPPALAQALPLGERPAAQEEADDAADEAPPPDNRAGWNAIAKSYQEHRYGDRDAGRLKWSWGLFEDEMHLLPDDVRGLHALVLGCGGGQDVVALERMGAIAVGLDLSHEQIAYARKYAQRHGAQNASFVEGTLEDLSRFDDERFDLAVSIHAMAYASDLQRAFAEASRVLRHGAVLALSVPHPFNQALADDPPYAVARSYWDETIDWTWEFEDGASARLRERTPTVSAWFDLLVNAGFTVERILEPYQGDLEDHGARIDRLRVQSIPYVMILIARKR